MKQDGRSHVNLAGLPGKVLVSLYVLAAALPVLAASVSGIEAAPTLSELGTAFGLTAGALLFLQFLSSGRYESLSGRIGIDRAMGFHRVAAYVLPTFPLGYLWHLTWFASQYQALQIYRPDVIIPFGLLSMLIQGMLLSWLFPRIADKGASWLKQGLMFGAGVGLFAWQLAGGGA